MLGKKDGQHHPEKTAKTQKPGRAKGDQTWGRRLGRNNAQSQQARCKAQLGHLSSDFDKKAALCLVLRCRSHL